MRKATPEEEARELIDANLELAGWVVQDRDQMNLSAGRGVAVREFRLAPGHGHTDYLLFVDEKAVGALEAKPKGHTLKGVEVQSGKYSAGLPKTAGHPPSGARAPNRRHDPSRRNSRLGGGCSTLGCDARTSISDSQAYPAGTCPPRTGSSRHDKKHPCRATAAAASRCSLLAKTGEAVSTRMTRILGVLTVFLVPTYDPTLSPIFRSDSGFLGMADDQDGLVDLLLSHVVEARAKYRLVEFLRSFKSKEQLPRSAFRVSGGVDDMRETIRKLVKSDDLPLQRLSDLVDMVEENGGQHVFLFSLTASGQATVTEARAAKSFPNLPKQPTASFYSKLPQASRAYLAQRNGAIVVKEVRMAEYWVLDAEAGRETEDRRTIVYKKVRRRAVNLFIADPATNLVQIRIARAADRDDIKVAKDLFQDFRDRLEPLVDLSKHLEPIPIWNGYPKIVKAKNETYMSHDEAEDPSVLHRLSNRRARTAGTDVRDHASYDMDSGNYKRKSLNVFWKIQDAPDEDSYIHTVMTRVRFDTPPPPIDCGKVYIAATVQPAELDHVLDRIRHFAR